MKWKSKDKAPKDGTEFLGIYWLGVKNRQGKPIWIKELVMWDDERQMFFASHQMAGSSMVMFRPAKFQLWQPISTPDDVSEAMEQAEREEYEKCEQK